MNFKFSDPTKSNFSILENSDEWKRSSALLQTHFRLYMHGKIFGAEETLNAFHHYRAGWKTFVDITVAREKV
jgi:hypothetical protein